MCDFAMRDCYLCGISVPSELHDYQERHRYKCSTCGEYQITSEAETLLATDKNTLKKIVKNGQSSNDEGHILTISSKAIKAEKR